MHANQKTSCASLWPIDVRNCVKMSAPCGYDSSSSRQSHGGTGAMSTVVLGDGDTAASAELPPEADAGPGVDGDAGAAGAGDAGAAFFLPPFDFCRVIDVLRLRPTSADPGDDDADAEAAASALAAAGDATSSSGAVTRTSGTAGSAIACTRARTQKRAPPPPTRVQQPN